MKYKIFVEIKTYATSLFVQLEQNEIGLSYDGDNSFKVVFCQVKVSSHKVSFGKEIMRGGVLRI